MKYYLAPMEGLTTYTFRTAYNHYFKEIDKYFTPFISNRSLSSRERNDILPEHNAGMKLVPQILANRPEEFLEIANAVSEYGYDTVNLNLGCPSGTVVAKGRGAGFLQNLDELRRFLEAIYDRCALKISIKTRIGIESAEEWEPLLRLYSAFPVEELIIHPRLQREFYAGQPHKSAYRRAEELLSVPLCYNGDIVSRESLASLIRELPAVNTVMIGRGILQRPNLPAELREEQVSSQEEQVSFQEENVSSQGKNVSSQGKNVSPRKETASCPQSVLRAFHDELLEGYLGIMSGEQPVLYKMKDFWTFFSRGFESPERYLKKVRKANGIAGYKAAVNELFQACPYK